jgi:ferredoxin-fold anticodon binding domain-containing protein
MRLGFCLIAVSLFLVNLALADEELRPIDRVKRNRFKMKDKSVVYNDSLEEDAVPGGMNTAKNIIYILIQSISQNKTGCESLFKLSHANFSSSIFLS